jgi:peptidyl-tRNA hydrolase
MNLSAHAVEALMKTYSQVKLENVMLVVDDLDHKPGNVKLKKTGSAE